MQYTKDKAKKDYAVAIVTIRQSAFIASRNGFEQIVVGYLGWFGLQGAKIFSGQCDVETAGLKRT